MTRSEFETRLNKLEQAIKDIAKPRIGFALTFDEKERDDVWEDIESGRREIEEFCFAVLNAATQTHKPGTSASLTSN